MINEVYILDSDFQTLGVIDEFISCIWTERYSRAGDFEIVCPVNDNTTALLYRSADDLVDRYATIRDSNTYMVIENVLLTTDTEDGDKYTVTGRSIESLLDRRVVWEHYVSENVTISNVIMALITQNATSPSDPERVLDIFRPNGSWFVASSSNAEKRLKIADYYGDNLYDVITSLCEAYHIGFRAVPMGVGKFQLQIYDGKDRTYDQLERPYVVFSGKFDNLLQSRWQKNTAGMKNYILVRGDADYDPVFLDGDALLKATAVQNAQIYSGAHDDIVSTENEIKEQKQRLNDLTVRLARFPYVYGDEESELQKEALEHEISVVRNYIALLETRLVNSENDYDKYRYWNDVQNKLGDPNKQKMMLCSPVEKVTGLARREMWIDDSTELEKDEATIKLEEQNATYEAQITQVWEEYWGNVDPVSGVPRGDIEEVKQQVATLRAGINRNNRIIEQNNKQTLDRYYSHLSEVGRMAIAEHSITTSFDGDVASNVQYLYGRDYFLGDLVQIRNDYGMEAVTRVTEVMRSRDEAGDYVIPTFVSDGGSNGT